MVLVDLVMPKFCPTTKTVAPAGTELGDKPRILGFVLNAGRVKSESVAPPEAPSMSTSPAKGAEEFTVSRSASTARYIRSCGVKLTSADVVQVMVYFATVVVRALVLG